MRRLPLCLLLLALLGASTGCGHGYHHRGHGHGHGMVLLAAELVTTIAIAAVREHEHVSAREIVVVHEREVSAPTTPDTPVGIVVTPLPPPPRDLGPTPKDAPPFDAQRARSALGGVDLSTCRAAGAPRGYGHAVVTFNPAGNISKVVIDTPSGLSPDAATCIGQALGAVAVPPYRGSLLQVGTTWFVP